MKTTAKKALPKRRPIGPPATGPQIPLQDVAGRFLDEKALHVTPQHLYMIEYPLRDLSSGFGQVPIGSVTGPMIRQALFAREREPYTNKLVLQRIRNFFDWARMEGFLPPGPTSADLVQIDFHLDLLPIVQPEELRALLAGGDEVELRLAVALWSFAPLRYSESRRATWENVLPGRLIRLVPDSLRSRGLILPMRPVLDAWLQPYYGAQGPILLSSGDLHPRCRHLGRMQGVKWNPSTLRRSGCAYAMALGGTARKTPGLRGYKRLGGLPEAAKAREFFSLTPEKVGLVNWPQLVAEHLAKSKTRSVSRRHPCVDAA